MKNIVEEIKNALRAKGYSNNLLKSIFSKYHDFSVIEVHEDPNFAELLKNQYGCDAVEARARLFEEVFTEAGVIALESGGLMQSSLLPFTVFTGQSLMTRQPVVILVDNETRRVVFITVVTKLDRKEWEKILERLMNRVRSFYSGLRTFELTE